MAYAFRSSARAMAITSSTTSVAFFANIFSPLLPIKTFGIFSGVIIPINFFLVVTFMPPAVIIYEEYIKNFSLCFWRVTKIASENDSDEDVKNDEENEEQARSEDERPSNEQEKLGSIEKFFDGPLNKFVYKNKVPIVFVSIVWFIYASTQAALLGPQTEQEEFIDSEHPAVVVYTRMGSEFPAPP